MVGYGLVQSLSCLNSKAIEDLCRHSPWRQGNPITAGQSRKGLARMMVPDNKQSRLGPHNIENALFFYVDFNLFR